MTKHTPITPADDAAHPHAEDPVAPPEQASDTPPLLPENALVPVAPRHDGWTPPRQREFIETLADTGSVTAAAQAAGMSVQSAWRLRRRADARGFDLAWEAALERSLQQLLPVAIDRAINGTLRQRFYHGQLIGEERVYHDELLLHLLENGARTLGAARARRKLGKDWEGNMAALEAGEALPVKPIKPVEPVAPKGYDVDRHDDRWVTDAPWPDDVDEEDASLEIEDKNPGWKGWRYASVEEAAHLDAKERRWQQEWEASRRRFFELD